MQAERGDPRAAQLEQRHEELVRELETRHHTEPLTIAPVAQGYSNVGRLKADRGDFSGAENAYRKSVDLFESLPKGARSADDLRSHSYALKRLGAVRLRASDYDESERYYRQALVLDDEVILLDDRPQTRYDVTFTLSDLALVQSRRGRWDDAVAMWQRALAIRQAAVDADPKNTRPLIGVATLYGRLGNAAAAQGDPLASAARYRDELVLRDRAIAIVGPLPGRVSEQAWARLNLAEALLNSAAVIAGASVSGGLGGRGRPACSRDGTEQRKGLGHRRLRAGLSGAPRPPRQARRHALTHFSCAFRL